MARSPPSISPIFASTSFSPSALPRFARPSALSPRARSFIAARSSSLNPVVLPADLRGAFFGLMEPSWTEAAGPRIPTDSRPDPPAGHPPRPTGAGWGRRSRIPDAAGLRRRPPDRGLPARHGTDASDRPAGRVAPLPGGAWRSGRGGGTRPPRPAAGDRTRPSD